MLIPMRFRMAYVLEQKRISVPSKIMAFGIPSVSTRLLLTFFGPLQGPDYWVDVQGLTTRIRQS